jgi:PAS domain S-box-containing protein
VSDEREGKSDAQPTTLTLSLATRLLAQTPDGILAFDREWRYTLWNAAMERLTGMSAAQVLGHQAFEVFPFLLEIGEDRNLRRALAGEEVSSRARPYRIPGTNRQGFFDAAYSPLRDENGEIQGVVGIVRDVSDQHWADERIRETEGRFRTMADAAPVLLWMSDTDGLCTFFNQTWLDFTGRTLDQEWGVGWAEGVHFEDLQRCLDFYVENFNKRRVFEMEYRLRRRDGEYRWILDRGHPRTTPDGTFAGFIGSCIDITERRALEGDLRRAVQVRDEFLSIASHELKTPLTALQLQIDNLHRCLERAQDGQQGGQQGGQQSLRVANSAAAVAEQSQRLTELVDLLLDVSRINSGRLRFDCSEFDLVDLVRTAVERWRQAVNRRQGDSPAPLVESLFTTDLPDRLLGTWDRLRMEQVLNNLLSNAVKYGENQPIHVQVSASGARARLQVVDHGIGIAAADQPRIFGRFERAVSSRHYGGLGLGLWITRQIVESMGGSIGVESESGKGSVFTVDLPRSLIDPGGPGRAPQTVY